MSKTNQNPKTISLAPFVWTFVILNFTAVSAFVFVLHQSYVRTEAAAIKTTQNITQMLGDSINTSALRIDTALQMVVYDLESQLRRSRSLNKDEVDRLLKATKPVLGDLSQVRIANVNGQVLYGEGVSRREHPSYSNRDYFISHRDNPGKGLIVSNPVFGTVIKRWVIPFSRRYNHPDGSFAGVVVAGAPITCFGDLLASSGVGSHGVVVLRDSSLGVIVRYPALDTEAGSIGAKGFSTKLQAAVDSKLTSVSYHIRSGADGIEHAVTYRRLAPLPFHLVAGLNTHDYMKPWGDEVRISLIRLTIFMLLTAVLLFMLYRRTTALMDVTAISLRDPLTGLPNRRAFDNEYERLRRHTVRNHSVISVLFIDIDHFKKINDTYGHDIGDTVLKRVAGAIESCLHRPLDMVCRWGGEEFAAVLPDTALDGAELLAKKILCAVRQIEMPIGLKRGGCSVSIGVASMSLLPGMVSSDLIGRADMAMMAAKQLGRDQYVVFVA
ncbi:MAG: diguanylate cyclase [Desulfuromonadaceae bacterium]|nr:diguanylate cyclase [Desulfuromonadaceae bacterium]